MHFHALVQIDKVNSKIWDDAYGNLDFEKAYNKNNVAIAKYINKLTNHAIKESAKGNRCMFNRQKRKSDII